MSDERDRIKGLWRSARRAAIVVLATLVGGYIWFWVAMFWAIPTPSYILGGGYRMMFAAFVLTPMAAVASGFLAFVLPEVKQRTTRFALCGAVLAPTLATVITEVVISQMHDPTWPSRLSSEGIRAVGLSIGAIALVGALGGIAISHMADR